MSTDNNCWTLLNEEEKKALQDDYHDLMDDSAGKWKLTYSKEERDGIVRYLEARYGKDNLLGVQKLKTWDDLIESGLISGDILCQGLIESESITFSKKDVTPKVVGKALATMKIATLIEHLYGGVVSDEHLINGVAYTIVCNMVDESPMLRVVPSYDTIELLSFHTVPQAEQFLINNVGLVCDYYMVSEAALPFKRGSNEVDIPGL